MHFGKWLIDGEPSLMLIEFKGMMPYVNEIKQELWRLHGVDSLGSGFDFDEPVAWGYAVGKLLKSIAGEMPTKKILAHFHEWLAASALVYIKKRNLILHRCLPRTRPRSAEAWRPAVLIFIQTLQVLIRKKRRVQISFNTSISLNEPQLLSWTYLRRSVRSPRLRRSIFGQRGGCDIAQRA